MVFFLRKNDEIKRWTHLIAFEFSIYERAEGQGLQPPLKNIIFSFGWKQYSVHGLPSTSKQIWVVDTLISLHGNTLIDSWTDDWKLRGLELNLSLESTNESLTHFKKERWDPMLQLKFPTLNPLIFCVPPPRIPPRGLHWEGNHPFWGVFQFLQFVVFFVHLGFLAFFFPGVL